MQFTTPVSQSGSGFGKVEPTQPRLRKGVVAKQASWQAAVIGCSVFLLTRPNPVFLGIG